jgi:8-oxo-dGTP pyrophosphatase MutT (NUDIX family)
MDDLVCSGALIYSVSTDRVLFLQRSAVKGSSWALVGGKMEPNEGPWQGLQREIIEEIGFMPEIIKTIPLETYIGNFFRYHTYVCLVKQEFIPRLNHEHTGYSWANVETPPMPLHNGLKNTLHGKQNIKKFNTIKNIGKYFIQ